MTGNMSGDTIICFDMEQVFNENKKIKYSVIQHLKQKEIRHILNPINPHTLLYQLVKIPLIKYSVLRSPDIASSVSDCCPLSVWIYA